ncbi:uncharacterized protein LOC107052717 isoform X2 [Gallus gallus]|uniref:uncharacterized protein LOC107052717 isoform X2 n=1 Tax=Gallus gallus TaxID=9031 RepID=UPI001F020227|nr:uncharacterized protein LOC107052717 isoform X2 [Gallus gallus]
MRYPKSSCLELDLQLAQLKVLTPHSSLQLKYIIKIKFRSHKDLSLQLSHTPLYPQPAVTHNSGGTEDEQQLSPAEPPDSTLTSRNEKTIGKLGTRFLGSSDKSPAGLLAPAAGGEEAERGRGGDLASPSATHPRVRRRPRASCGSEVPFPSRPGPAARRERGPPRREGCARVDCEGSERRQKGERRGAGRGERDREAQAQPPPMFVIVVSRFRRRRMPGEGGPEEEPRGGSGCGGSSRTMAQDMLSTFAEEYSKYLLVFLFTFLHDLYQSLSWISNHKEIIYK